MATKAVRRELNAAERFWANPKDPRHGTENGYSNLKCKCDPCKDANAAAVVEDREQRRGRPIPDHVHGTENGYRNWGCKCGLCKAEWTRVSTRRRKRSDARKKAEREGVPFDPTPWDPPGVTVRDALTEAQKLEIMRENAEAPPTELEARHEGLNTGQCSRIRKSLSQGVAAAKLADKYGVSEATIMSLVLTNEKDVEGLKV